MLVKYTQGIRLQFVQGFGRTDSLFGWLNIRYIFSIWNVLFIRWAIKLLDIPLLMSSSVFLYDVGNGCLIDVSWHLSILSILNWWSPFFSVGDKPHPPPLFVSLSLSLSLCVCVFNCNYNTAYILCIILYYIILYYIINRRSLESYGKKGVSVV